MQEQEVIRILQNQLNYTAKNISDIKIFINELLKANKKHNFISKSTENVIWHRHILDSAQLVKFIDLSKGFFIGKDKLLTVNKKTKLFGIICQNIIPFSGLKIFYKNKIVGQTTVGAFSPYFGRGIGYALFNYNNNWIEKKLYIKDHENNLHDCQIVTLPFFDESKKIPKLVNANLS